MSSGNVFSSWWLTVLLATVVGSGLRLGAIAEQSFWYDEAFVDSLANRASYSDIITGRSRDNGNPPLYFLVAKFSAERLGIDEACYRLPPAVFGILTIPLIALLGRRLHSRQAGAVAAWLLAISPVQIELSDEARVYSFLHLITTLDSILFLRWLSSRSWRDGLAYAAGIAVACYAHYYIVFFVLSHLVVLTIQEDRWWLLRRWCLLMCVSAVLWLPWLSAFFHQLTAPGNLSRMDAAWQTQFLATPTVLAVGRSFAWRDAGSLRLGLAVLVSITAFWSLFVIGVWRREANAKVAVPMLAAWVLLPIIIPLFAAIGGVPVYLYRYGTVGLPGFLIGVAIGFGRLPRKYQAAATIVILASTMFSLSNYYRYPNKDDWRSATNAVLSNLSQDEVIAIDSEIEAVPFLYYARQQHKVPRTMYEMIMENSGEDTLIGVKCMDGQRQTNDRKDCTSEILSARFVTVALCVSVRDADWYKSFFERNGFRTSRTEEFYRVTVMRFEKVSGEKPGRLMPNEHGTR
jgi:mannosyltransferase